MIFSLPPLGPFQTMSPFVLCFWVFKVYFPTTPFQHVEIDIGILVFYEPPCPCDGVVFFLRFQTTVHLKFFFLQAEEYFRRQTFRRYRAARSFRADAFASQFLRRHDMAWMIPPVERAGLCPRGRFRFRRRNRARPNPDRSKSFRRVQNRLQPLVYDGFWVWALTTHNTLIIIF